MSSKNQEEEVEGIKIILVGESGTGKTSLINSIQGYHFIEGSQASTMTCSFIKLKAKIQERELLIYLWDTIGQEKFRSLTKIFISNAKIVIFVFDITDVVSFNALDFWYETIENELGKDPIKAIAANKQDLFENQDVDDDKIKEYADKKGIKFMYTTAKNPTSFNMLLEDLLKIYLEKSGKTPKSLQSNNKRKKLKNKEKKDNTKKKKCC